MATCPAGNGGFFSRLPFVAAVLLLAASAGGAAARAETPAIASQPDDAQNGRFAMTPVADGFLRLDTRTGQVSLCALASGQVQCRAAADERAALEGEIERLAKENAQLKAGAPAPPPKSEEEEDRRFDRALDRAERFARRMLELFRESEPKNPPNNP